MHGGFEYCSKKHMKQTAGSREEKRAAVEAIRRQLGTRVTSGSELLRVQESREARAATGMAGLNQQLGGGLSAGQLTEILSGHQGGAGLVMAALLAQARRERKYVLLIDVGCGFSPESIPEVDLEVILWVGCRSLPEAVASLDVATRDENFSLFLIDLRGCSAADGRSVRPGQWQRILGQLRQRDGVGVVFADEPITSVARRRIRVEARFSCADLDEERSVLWEALTYSLVERESGSRASRALYEQRVG